VCVCTVVGVGFGYKLLLVTLVVVVVVVIALFPLSKNTPSLVYPGFLCDGHFLFRQDKL
jgi:hypothetical protein